MYTYTVFNYSGSKRREVGAETARAAANASGFDGDVFVRRCGCLWQYHIKPQQTMQVIGICGSDQEYFFAQP